MEAAIPAAAFPDIPFDALTFEGALSSVACGPATLGDLSVESGDRGGADSTLEVSLYNASLSCTAEFAYREKVWPHWPSGGGSLLFSMARASARATVAVRGRVPGQEACDGGQYSVRPLLGLSLCVACRQVVVEAGDVSVKITRGSPILRPLANVILGLFSLKVSGDARDRIEAGLRSAIDVGASRWLELATSTHPVKAMGAEVGARLTLSGAPTLSGNSSLAPGQGYESLPFRGDVVPDPSSHPFARLPLVVPPAPTLDDTAPAFGMQMWLSNSSIVSPLYSLAACGALNGTAPPSLLPPPLNTTGGGAWSLIIPSLPDAFWGPRSGVGLRVSFVAAQGQGREVSPLLPSLGVSSWPRSRGSGLLSLPATLELVVFPLPASREAAKSHHAATAGDEAAEECEPTVAVRWPAVLSINASLWIQPEEEEEEEEEHGDGRLQSPVVAAPAGPQRLRADISSLSFLLNGSEGAVWTSPALGPSPEVRTGVANEWMSTVAGKIVLPIVNRILAGGMPLQPIPLGRVPSSSSARPPSSSHPGSPAGLASAPTGERYAPRLAEDAVLALSLVRTTLIARGPVVADGGAAASTASRIEGSAGRGGGAGASPTDSAGLYLQSDYDIVLLTPGSSSSSSSTGMDDAKTAEMAVGGVKEVAAELWLGTTLRKWVGEVAARMGPEVLASRDTEGEGDGGGRAGDASGARGWPPAPLTLLLRAEEREKVLALQ